MPAAGKFIYLSFDDGPHPVATPWVLNELGKYDAKGTFFCIGKNVVQFPELYSQILAAGHNVGNHTFSHLNGWKTPVEHYMADIEKATGPINSHLFRPPYGRIRRGQAKRLKSVLQKDNAKVVMWDVLSADFDTSLTGDECANIVLKHAEPGSIVVFHDSEKAFPRLKIALPVVLATLSEIGYSFRNLEAV